MDLKRIINRKCSLIWMGGLISQSAVGQLHMLSGIIQIKLYLLTLNLLLTPVMFFILLPRLQQRERRTRRDRDSRQVLCQLNKPVKCSSRQAAEKHARTGSCAHNVRAQLLAGSVGLLVSGMCKALCYSRNETVPTEQSTDPCVMATLKTQ